MTDWDRIMSNLTPEPNSGCWLWTLQTGPLGYGSTRILGRRSPIGVHRAVWMLLHGPIPDGMEVCHRCDVRACANPDHLFLGTHRENMEDCARKGRIRAVPGGRSRRHPDRERGTLSFLLHGLALLESPRSTQELVDLLHAPRRSINRALAVYRYLGLLHPDTQDGPRRMHRAIWPVPFIPLDMRTNRT